jgi:hypothetical protein
MEKQKERFDQGKIGIQSKADSSLRHRVEYISVNDKKKNPILTDYPALKKILPIIRKNKLILDKQNHMTTQEGQIKRMHFVRYVDDILIGLRGTKEECHKIMSSINNFIQEELKLELNYDKCEVNLT